MRESLIAASSSLVQSCDLDNRLPVPGLALQQSLELQVGSASDSLARPLATRILERGLRRRSGLIEDFFEEMTSNRLLSSLVAAEREQDFVLVRQRRALANGDEVPDSAPAASVLGEQPRANPLFGVGKARAGLDC